jgi:hypothetical protein
MLIKLVHFQNLKKKTFLLLFKQTFFWYMSKMYLWELTLVTIFEPVIDAIPFLARSGLYY